MNGSLAELQDRPRQKTHDPSPRQFRMRRIVSVEQVGRKMRYVLECGHVIERNVNLGRKAACRSCGQEGRQ